MRKSTVIALALLAGLLAGCGSADDRGDIVVARPAETMIPSGTADPRVQPVVTTYQLFLQAAQNAQRKPLRQGRAYPDKADFLQYSFDPVQTQYQAFNDLLVRRHHAFRGTPPRSTISVRSIDLDASPFPTVTLSDCQTERDDWRAHDVRTDVIDPSLTPDFAAPYGSEVTLVYQQQHWGVQTILPDPAGLCAG